MEREEVLVVLREKAVAVLGVNGIAEDLPLAGVDSLALVELAMDLEDTCGIELTEADVSGAGTIGELVDVVVAKAT